MNLSSPSISTFHNPILGNKNSSHSSIKSMAMKRSVRTSAATSPLESPVSLAAQTSSLSQRLLVDLATETAKYVFPSRSFEEALMPGSEAK